MKKFIVVFMVGIIALNCCNYSGKNEKVHIPIKVIYEKKFGFTQVFMCLVQDSNWVLIKQESEELVKNAEIGFVFCYDDKTKIRNINAYNNGLDALPGEKVDYVCELLKRPGGPIEFNKVVENYNKVEGKGDLDKIKFVLLDKKERNCGGRTVAICRWYVFYIENFYDNKEVYEKMKLEAMKLPVDDPNDKGPNKHKPGCTEVYFFKDKINVPKLEADGGWGPKESANSMDNKFGKYLVGHIGLGCGDELYFSKGF